MAEKEQQNAEMAAENKDAKDNENFEDEDLKAKAEKAKYYESEAIENRKKFQKARDELKKLQDEVLPENEKSKKRIEELEEQLTTLKNIRLENMILSSAINEKFVDMGIVKLLVREELAGREDIDESMVEKTVKKIAKEKPYLVSAGESATPNTGNQAKSGTDGKSDNQKFAEWLRK